MDDELYELDGIFGASVDADVYSGYRKLADPIIRLMQKSARFTKIVSFFAMPWAEEMGHRLKPDKYKSNKIGKLIMDIGIPICRFIGRNEVCYAT